MYYDYVPTLPYKNARQLNKNTMQCEPKKLCPRRVGVSFDKKAQKCFDFYQGIFVSFVDAVNPYNRSERMIRVKFIC